MYTKISLLFLTLFSTFLYFYTLSSIPSGFYADEVTIGYNAYSLLKTGRDEYGQFLPIALRLFGSYTPPLYAYVTMLPISLFGLSVFSTRFISSLAGVISVIIVFFFLKVIFHTKKDKGSFLPFYGALFSAISPWVVFYSRLGYEVYFAFMLLLWGIYYLYKGLENNFYIALATIPLSLSTYASHTTKYLAPLLFILFVILFSKHINIQKIVKRIRIRIVLLISLLTLLPNLYLLTTDAFLVKNDLFYQEAILNRAKGISLPDVIAYPYAFGYEFIARYLSYFSPYSLFTHSDNDPQRSLPSLSVFYTWMIIPYLFGFYTLIKSRKDLSSQFILFLLILTPLPAALTHDPFSTQRALPFLFPIFLVIWYGISFFLMRLQKVLQATCLILLFAISFLFLYRSYFVLFPNFGATAWGYGYIEVFEALKKYDQKIVFDNSRTKPLLPYSLFVNQTDPQKSHDVQTIENYYTPQGYSGKNIDTLQFRPIMWEKDIYKDQIIVGDHLTFSEDSVREHKLEKVFEINAPFNDQVFVGYKTNPREKCKGNSNLLCNQKN